MSARWNARSGWSATLFATTALSGLMLAVPAAAQTAVQDIGGLSTTIASSRPAS
jgi:hypothetical protein